MLVLTRKLGEEIKTTNGITIRVVAIHGQQVRLGIDAPRDVGVDRCEVFARKQAEQAAQADNHRG